MAMILSEDDDKVEEIWQTQE